eukprot:3235713-Amphidinium_carterae.1
MVVACMRSQPSSRRISSSELSVRLIYALVRAIAQSYKHLLVVRDGSCEGVLDGEEESKRRSRKSTGTTQVDGVRPAGFQEKKEWSPSGLRRSSSEVQLK